MLISIVDTYGFFASNFGEAKLEDVFWKTQVDHVASWLRNHECPKQTQKIWKTMACQRCIVTMLPFGCGVEHPQEGTVGVLADKSP